MTQRQEKVQAAMDRAKQALGEKRMMVGQYIVTKTQVMALPSEDYDLRLAVVEDIE